MMNFVFTIMNYALKMMDFVSPQGACHLEVTCGSVGVVRPQQGGEEGDLSALRSGRLLHTNHYLHDDFAHLNSDFPGV